MVGNVVEDANWGKTRDMETTKDLLNRATKSLAPHPGGKT
jgi:hypothetical protein